MAKSVPERPIKRQRSEKTISGRGARVEERVEMGLEGLSGLEEE